MSNKHTAKSVGLAPAFPFVSFIPQDVQASGMTFAAYLYSQNQAANVGNKLSSSDIKNNVKEQLKEVANLLNDLEDMK